MQTQIFPCWSLEVLETIPLTISNWISIQKHNIDRAQANGEQPASIETENFDDAVVNWSRRRRHTKHLVCAPKKWRQVTNNLRGVRFAWIVKQTFKNCSY